MIKLSPKQLRSIAQQYHIADIYLFGSQATGFARKESDVDIAVRFSSGLPAAEQRGKIYGDLFSDLAGCAKGAKKIDLVFLDELPLHFQFKIINEGKLVLSDNLESSYNFQEDVINRYRDYKYFIDEYFQGILAAPTASL